MSDNVETGITVERVVETLSQGVAEQIITVDVVSTSVPEMLRETVPVIESLETFGTELVAETIERIDVVEVAGRQGPPGVSEEDVVYTKRVDQVSDAVLYRGEAAVGSTEASPVWRIRRFTFGEDGDIAEEWANGTAEFTHAWTDRLTLTYS